MGRRPHGPEPHGAGDRRREGLVSILHGPRRGAWAAGITCVCRCGLCVLCQVESIGRQADSLVQEGDSHASGALAVSLRTQTLRLLAHVVAYLRVLATSLAEDDQVGRSPRLAVEQAPHDSLFRLLLLVRWTGF